MLNSAVEEVTAGQQARLTIAGLGARASRHNVVHQECTVCWRRFGDGPPLVLLHGGHGNWMHWVRNIEALALQHTVWVPDLPGFGDSGDLSGEAHAPDRLQRLLEVLAGTLDAVVGPGTVIDLAGFSFGGLVAAHLATRRAGVRRVALLGPAGHGGQRRQSAEMLDWRLPDRVAMRAALRHNLGAFMLNSPGSMDSLAMKVHEISCVQTRFRSKSFSRTAELKSILNKFSQPLLMIWGEHDVTVMPEQISERLAEGHAEREWCVVPRAGHWVQYERYKDINPLLLSWFALEEGNALGGPDRGFEPRRR